MTNPFASIILTAALAFTTVHLPAPSKPLQAPAHIATEDLKDIYFKDEKGKPLTRQQASELMKTGMYKLQFLRDEHSKAYAIVKKYRNTPQKRVNIVPLHP
jgi:hypothetical protein